MFYHLHRRKTFRYVFVPPPPVTLGYVDNENSLGNFAPFNDLNSVTLSYVDNFVYNNDINQITLGYVDHNIPSYTDINQITLGYVDIDTEAISDYPPVTLSVSPSSVAENSGTNIVYTFTRAITLGTNPPITINYLVGGTANSFDYTGTSPGLNTITLSTGTSVTLTITPTPDAVNEANDTISITLQTGLGYVVGTTTAVIATINNDD